jgi:hypothetical protein
MNKIPKYKTEFIQQANNMQTMLKKTAVLFPLSHPNTGNISVCEESLGLSILVSMIRRFGNDYFQSYREL